MQADTIELTAQRVDGFTYVEVNGVLADETYQALRDGLFKFAAESPEAIVVDIDAMVVAHNRLLAVFTVVAMQICDWPGTPLTLLAKRDDMYTMLSESTICRFVPVLRDRADVAEAIQHPQRRRARLDLSTDAFSSRRAREFVKSVCAAWGVEQFVDDAQLVATELVENALRHTASAPRLRLELRRGTLTVAVNDDDPSRPVQLEHPSCPWTGKGLRVVAQVARVWGATPTWTGGKVVWAVLGRVPRPRSALGKG